MRSLGQFQIFLFIFLRKDFTRTKAQISKKHKKHKNGTKQKHKKHKDDF